MGSQLTGKPEHRKNLTEIMVAHRIADVAQASPHDPADLIRKATKALAVNGPTFLKVLSPCPRGWCSEAAEGIAPALLDGIQQWVDDEWVLLLRKCGEPPESEWTTRKTRSAAAAATGRRRCARIPAHERYRG